MRLPHVQRRSVAEEHGRAGYLFYDSYDRTYLPTMRIAQMGGWLNAGLFGDSAILSLVDYVHGNWTNSSASARSPICMRSTFTACKPASACALK